MQRFEILT